MLRSAAFLVLLVFLAAYGGFKLHVIFDTFAATPSDFSTASKVITHHINPIAQADADARAALQPQQSTISDDAASSAAEIAPAAGSAKTLDTQEETELLNLISRSDTARKAAPLSRD